MLFKPFQRMDQEHDRRDRSCGCKYTTEFGTKAQASLGVHVCSVFCVFSHSFVYTQKLHNFFLARRFVVTLT